MDKDEKKSVGESRLTPLAQKKDIGDCYRCLKSSTQVRKDTTGSHTSATDEEPKLSVDINAVEPIEEENSSIHGSNRLSSGNHSMQMDKPDINDNLKFIRNSTISRDLTFVDTPHKDEGEGATLERIE